MSKADYFNHFPLINYWTADAVPVTIRHILPRTRVIKAIGTTSGDFVTYRILDEETIESVSHKVYGDARWYWVIALYNDLVDVFEQWPVHSSGWAAMMQDKYPNQSYSTVHHYVDAEGFEVQVKYSPGALPVTILEYETALNDALRVIKIPNKRYLAILEQMLTDVMVDA